MEKQVAEQLLDLAAHEVGQRFFITEKARTWDQIFLVAFSAWFWRLISNAGISQPFVATIFNHGDLPDILGNQAEAVTFFAQICPLDSTLEGIDAN